MKSTTGIWVDKIKHSNKKDKRTLNTHKWELDLNVNAIIGLQLVSFLLEKKTNYILVFESSEKTEHKKKNWFGELESLQHIQLVCFQYGQA